MYLKLSAIALFTLYFGAADAQQNRKTSRPPTPADYIKTQLSPPLKDDPSPVKKIKIVPDTGVLIPKWFYIQTVTAAEEINDSIGFVLQPKSAKKQKLVLQDGSVNSVQNWLDKKIVKDTTLYPLTFHIKKMNVEEKIEANLWRTGKYNFRFEIGYTQNGKTYEISGYEGAYDYFYHPANKMELDSVITASIRKLADAIDDGIGKAVNSSSIFCKKVKINFTYRTDNSRANDTLFYSGTTRLLWENFEAANTGVDEYYMQVSGLYFDPDVNYENGSIKINIQTGAYFIKSRSWAGRKAMRPDLLNHLNYTFRIAWLQSVRLKKKLEAMSFTCENFNKEIEKVVSESNKQLGEILDKYNRETLNGAKLKEQLRWEEFLDKQYNEYEIIK